jgi:hypothetical protein
MRTSWHIAFIGRDGYDVLYIREETDAASVKGVGVDF